MTVKWKKIGWNAPLQSHVALPLTAFIQYLLRLIFFSSSPVDVHAALMDGLLTALTPLAVIFGAIVFFDALKATGSLKTVANWTKYGYILFFFAFVN